MKAKTTGSCHAGLHTAFVIRLDHTQPRHNKASHSYDNMRTDRVHGPRPAPRTDHMPGILASAVPAKPSYCLCRSTLQSWHLSTARFPCSLRLTPLFSSCAVPAAISTVGVPLWCRHETFRTKHPAENPRCHNYTQNIGDEADDGNARLPCAAG